MKDGERLASHDDHGFPIGAALLVTVVQKGLTKAMSITDKRLCDEEKDMAQERRTPFAQAAMSVEGSGLVDAGVQSGEGHQGFGRREGAQVAGECQEESGQAFAEAWDGTQAFPGVGIALAHLLAQVKPDLLAAGFEFIPQGEQLAQVDDGSFVIDAPGGGGQGTQFVRRPGDAAAERGQVFIRSLGDLPGRRKGLQQAAQGFREATLASFEFREEQMEHLAEAILHTGHFLRELIIQRGQVAQGRRSAGLPGQTLFLPGREQPGSQGFGIDAVGFGLAQRAAATQVTGLQRRNQGDRMGQRLKMMQIQPGIWAGRLQADMPGLRRQGAPTGQERLPTRPVRRKSLWLAGVRLPLRVNPQEGRREGIFADVQANKTDHLIPPQTGFGEKGRLRSRTGLHCPCSRLIGALNGPINSLGMWKAGKSLLEGLKAHLYGVPLASPSASLPFYIKHL